MPELNINDKQNELIQALYLSSIMLFPNDFKKAQEYCAREKLNIIKTWCQEDPDQVEIGDHSLLNNLGMDIEIVLNSKNDQNDFLKMSKTRTPRGIWSGHVLFDHYQNLVKNPQEADIKNSLINAFDLIDNANKEQIISWYPSEDSKKDFGKKTWQNYKGVSHLWASTLRIHINIAKHKTDQTYQETIIYNFKHILSLAQWLYQEIEARRNKTLFDDPHKTWIIPENLTLPSFQEAFSLLQISQ